ncbi:MAG: peptidyl-tRNA hydrolase [Candidatus Heimdallarchaeota archaeon]|nr:peptidyl-tRNA hydrolase [Candidatus Heimdallarchaeota archaeon]
MKQILIIRTDLKMGKGKMAAQASHASVVATLDAQHSSTDWFNTWINQGMKKVAVKVSSEEDLNAVFRQAVLAKLPRALINDAGLTQLDPGTATAVAIGPAPQSRIDPITKQLKLL